MIVQRRRARRTNLSRSFGRPWREGGFLSSKLNRSLGALGSFYVTASLGKLLFVVGSPQCSRTQWCANPLVFFYLAPVNIESACDACSVCGGRRQRRKLLKN